MTDDAMREWLDPQLVACEDARRAKRIDDTKSAMEGFYSGWQAATATLLEKLKSEGVMEKCRDAAREQAAKGMPYSSVIHAENLKWTMIARAVIEALEKELVG